VNDVSEEAGNDELPCVRCQTPLAFVGERDFREGAGGNLLLPLGEFFEQATRFEVWVCQSCGHVELFVPGVGE
jgi:hypothetical protein